LARGVLRGTINWRSPEVLFAASCAVAPLVVFNQQVLTGRSLQPFHYEQFVINYVVIVGLVTTYQLVWQQLKIRRSIWVALAILVGVTTALKEVHDNSEPNIMRDKAEPVFNRLQSLSALSPDRGFALSNSTLLAASSLTSSSVPELWSPHMWLYENRGA